MSDQIWEGDACSLLEAFHKGEITPPEALELSLKAIESSQLNAVTHQDVERAKECAENADITLPFGGVPVGIKELDPVAGWPYTRASLIFKDEVADKDGIMVERLKAAGIVPVAQTAASEFGGINLTYTRIHGATHNPWQMGKTPGGSSGGSAAGVAGGLFPIASGGDGGGSIRIPAGFCGMFGLKSTFGRIPNGPDTEIEPITVVLGCISRSVRDSARWMDTCNGQSEYDPFSLPKVGGWEKDLGTKMETLKNKRVVVSPNLGSAFVASALKEKVEDAASALIKDASMKRTTVKVDLPRGGMEWAMAGMTTLLGGLGDLYPGCEKTFTPEIMFACNITQRHFNVDAAIKIDLYRKACIKAIASIFEEVDFIIASTNPDVAFDAKGPLPTTIDGVDLTAEHGFDVALGNNGALTIPCNTTGNPAVAIPIGLVNGLPVSMQIIGRHHAEQLLLELSQTVERERPWPLVAPGAPH